MYTRCPQCRTVFRITPAQLEARGGLVRCGVCAAAFQAGQNQLDTLPADADTTRAPIRPDDAGGEGATSSENPVETTERMTTAAAPDDDLPLMNELLPLPRRRRVPTAIWYLGVMLWLVVLAAQAAYFYAPQLARDARLKPWLSLYCERLGCDTAPPPGALPIDLAETAIEPHPQYQNALRLHAVLVNRAGRAQPWPLMEVSLTDSEGQVVARRHFTAAQYLESPAAGGAPPNVAVRAQLDVIHRDGRAVGYEIRLVAATP